MTSPFEQESDHFFQKHERIYPMRVWGKFRILKWAAMTGLLAIYYVTPWIRWDRGEYAPDQAILISIARQRMYFFDLEIWPQEIYFVTGILVLSALGLFYVTSLFGRVWCGYACPQTVWTDLFVWVERIVQGRRNERIKLDKMPLCFEKIWKKGLTHFIWVLIGMATGGAYVLYFNDAPTVIHQIIHFELPFETGAWIFGLTVSTYVLAGHARDQVCSFMCPYARFQSAMFDKDTLIIGYDEERGEPRGKHKQGESWDGRGDCIDCHRCVHVCPQGIDIRNGLQMQCIACGLCIDACNEIMDKVGLPQGLIRYDSYHHLHNKEEKGFHLLRPRTIYYTIIMAVIFSVFIYFLLNKSPLEMNVIRDRNPIFVKLSDGSIRNAYTIKILNKTREKRNYSLSIIGIKDAKLKLEDVDFVDLNNIKVQSDGVAQYRLYIIAPPTSLKGNRTDIRLSLVDNETHYQTNYKGVFVSGK